jgi:hypothetical protein
VYWYVNVECDTFRLATASTVCLAGESRLAVGGEQYSAPLNVRFREKKLEMMWLVQSKE